MQYNLGLGQRIAIAKSHSRNHVPRGEWKISREIAVTDKWIGTLEVCYLEEKQDLEEGPFLKEAKNIINAVAENIAKIIEREEAEDEIRKHQDHIEALIKKTAKKGDPHKNK